jgi:3-oxoadipate enol-lactonase
MAALASAHTVYTYDARGHGQSDLPPGPYSLDDFADDLAGVLDALGVDAAHVVGLSMGGMIVQQLAVSYPNRVRSLVLADTTSEYGQDARRQFAERARIAEERGMAPLIDATLERWLTKEFQHAHPEVGARIRAMLELAHPYGYAASCRAIGSIDLTERLVTINVPTLVLVGSADRSTPPDMALKIHEYIPGSSYEVIEGAAHLSNVSHAELFNQAILATIRRGELTTEHD